MRPHESVFRPPEGLPRPVLELLRALEAAGHEAYLVGGAPRDWLSARRPADFDVATSAAPPEVTALFRRVVPVAAEHGTVLVLDGGVPVEVSTFRRPGGRGASGPPGIVEDLSARDFTIDAMAWRPVPGRAPGTSGSKAGPADDTLVDVEGLLLDPFGGAVDLARGLLRTVGDPRERFAEDPLRVLRACRLFSVFCSELGGGCRSAMSSFAVDCAACAAERVTAELRKLFEAERVSPGLELMADVGLLDLLLPGVPSERSRMLDRLEADFVLRLACLLSGGPGGGRGDVRTCTAALRLSRSERGRLYTLIEAAETDPVRLGSAVELRRFMARTGRELLDQAFDLMEVLHGHGPTASARRAAESELARGLPLSVSELPLNGADLKSLLGLGEGPWVGRRLAELLEAVFSDPELADRERLLRFVEERMAKRHE